MTPETAENALFIAQSLLVQARQVRNFIKTYPAAFAGRRDDGEKALHVKFLASSERLFREVEALSLMARHPEIRKLCNREQVDAYLAEAREELAGMKNPDREPIIG